jgi:outer membrane protein assembly factor BamB
MWLHGAPPTAAGNAGDRWHDFTLEITKPDGTTETLGPFVSDPTGSTYALYTPDQVGTYTFVFKYSGQVLTLVNPQNGIAVSKTDPTLARFGGAAFENDTFLPSSATKTLVVQQQPVEKIPDYPLPSSYWTRPIEGQNEQWASVTSHWLSGAYLGWVTNYQQNLWQKDGVAPNTPHIMWTRPIEFGGIVGGTTDIFGTGFYSGGSYEGRFTNAMIIAGRLYYQEPLGHSNNGGGYTCVDLRTGAVIWHRDDIGVVATAGLVGTNTTTSTVQTAGPTFAQLYQYESPNQHGVVGAILWQTSTVGGVTTWQGIDAFTGKWAYNLTNVPAGFEVYTKKGEIVRYVLSYNTTTKKGTLGLWNNTCEQQGLHAAKGTVSEAWQWRPNGKVIDMRNAYSWKVNIDYDLTGDAAPTIVSVIPGDIIIGTSSALAWLGGVIIKTPDPIVVWAISDRDDGTRGQLLWLKKYPAPENFITPYWGPVDPVSRVWTLNYIETFEWVGYSVDTGEQLWGPVKGAQNDFSYYGSGKGGGQVGFVAYGNLYTQGFGGEIVCFSMSTGQVLWRYANTNSGIETVWGNYPIFIAAIADGKVYAFNNEHSPNYPLYKGEKIYCIDAFTGQELWTMSGWAGQTGGPGTSTGILAEGFFVYYNYYDNQIYCIGKGPSKTTVDAPTVAVPECQPITIRGTVTDISAGAKQLVDSGKFNIVPAVADESMSAFMEFLYMQKPCPANAKGVPVKLTAIDENGNTINIGTATSDASGLYAMTWTPPSAGMYKIVATFEGSGSYWPSSAETAISVSPAPEATPTPTTEAPVSATTGMVIVAVVVLALIIGLVNLLLLLKKKQ